MRYVAGAPVSPGGFRHPARVLRGAVLAALAPFAMAAGSDAPSPPPAELSLASPAFADEQPIPATHTCSDANRSPPLGWSGVPAGTEAFALVVEDVDAPSGSFIHWVLYDIGAEVRELPAAVPSIGRGAGGMKQGPNDFRDVGYGGPCPPPGAPHRYVFRLYALDAPTGLAPGASHKDLLAAIRGHVLAEATLAGTYAR